MVKKITQKSRISSPTFTVAITGGSGSIGSALLPRLIDKYKIYAFGRKIEGFREEISVHKNFQFIQCDFNNIESIPETGKVDTIIHLGGMVAGKNVDFEDYNKSNLHSTRLLLDFAKKQKVKKILFASSVSVYGKQNQVLTEDSPLKGSSDYALTKIAAEKILIENEKIPCTIFRIGSVYGPRNKSFVNKLIFLVKKRIVPFPNFGRDTKNFIFIDDLLEFILFELKINRKSSAIFNIVNPQKVLYSDLVKEIKNILQIKILLKIPMSPLLLAIVKGFNFLFYFFRLSRSRNFLDLSPLFGSQEISAKKAIEELGYSPKINIHEGIEKILQ